jgi:hypothetical protein
MSTIWDIQDMQNILETGSVFIIRAQLVHQKEQFQAMDNV